MPDCGNRHGCDTGMGIKCLECALDPAAIVDAQALGLLAEEQRPTRRASAQHPSTPPRKVALEKRVAGLQAEVSALKRAHPE